MGKTIHLKEVEILRVLVVTGANLKKNESANLSHLAFIKGFYDLGCDVTVISKHSNADIIDESITMPDGVEWHQYETSRMYKHISKEKRDSIHHEERKEKKSLKIQAYTKLREFAKGLYGVYGFNQVWINNAVKNFKDSHEYDLMISISTPPEGHEAAYQLRKKGRVKCRLFAEIWEDPWQLDIYNGEPNKKLLEVEKRITSYANKVFYVSPLTLNYQKQQFPETSDHMDWIPLASYYKSDPVSIEGYSYGYFGTYFPNGRNLRPFYEVAKEIGIELNICGSPQYLFEATSNIHIHERLPLEELKEYEDKTNVLVFVCNLKGGQIPGKIYQYAATNKKVLFILDGTTEEKKILKNYFKQFNRFYFCENQKESIKDTIIFLEKDSDLSKVTPLHDFDPPEIAKKIIEKCGL